MGGVTIAPEGRAVESSAGPLRSRSPHSPEWMNAGRLSRELWTKSPTVDEGHSLRVNPHRMGQSDGRVGKENCLGSLSEGTKQ